MIAKLSLPTGVRVALEADLKAWWDSQNDDWDAIVSGTKPMPLGGPDLWDRMPVVDSKVIARASPIFRRHLGISLDPTLIKKGGYRSFNEMIGDLVPKMIDKKAADRAVERAAS